MQLVISRKWLSWGSRLWSCSWRLLRGSWMTAKEMPYRNIHQWAWHLNSAPISNQKRNIDLLPCHYRLQTLQKLRDIIYTAWVSIWRESLFSLQSVWRGYRRKLDLPDHLATSGSKQPQDHRFEGNTCRQTINILYIFRSTCFKPSSMNITI